MKRVGIGIFLAYLGLTTMGCGGGGLSEGPPPETPKSSRTPEFEDMMKTMGPKMGGMSKGRPKDVPKAEPAKESAQSP